jgi:hypothetical protein
MPVSITQGKKMKLKFEYSQVTLRTISLLALTLEPSAVHCQFTSFAYDFWLCSRTTRAGILPLHCSGRCKELMLCKTRSMQCTQMTRLWQW